jgi:uncharacterized protein (DUF1810 family)
MATDDRFDLQRFVDAQAPVFETVLAELRSGQKRSHWMWFIFPQIAGLGQSAMAQRYAISAQDEAAAYLRHDVLGARLVACSTLTLAVTGRSALEIFGAIDAAKLRSSMTLFAQVAPPGQSVFREVLEKYYGGVPDEATLARV